MVLQSAVFYETIRVDVIRPLKLAAHGSAKCKTEFYRRLEAIAFLSYSEGHRVEIDWTEAHAFFIVGRINSDRA